MPEPSDSPNRLPWPPMILVATILSAFGLEMVWPTASPVRAWIGWLMISLGISLDMTAILTMRRHRTNILPNRPAGKLLTTGLFAFSRNPIYLGNTLWLTGLGPTFHSLWPVLLTPLAVLAMYQLAILREEAHLAAKFGDEWRAYCARTPRWFGLPR